MTRALERTYVRDGDGQFADVPGVGDDAVKLADKLKVGNRIQLGEGEKLLSSRKFKSSDDNSWDLLAAEVNTSIGREVRLGIVHPSHSKQWSAGSTDKIYERMDELDSLLADIDEDDDQHDALSSEREALAGQVGEGSSHSKTAILESAAVATLHAEIEEAQDAAADWAYEWDAFWENNSSDPNNIMTASDVTLAKGSIPTTDGDSLEWQVVGDGESEPASWRLEIGVRDSLADDDDWYIGRNEDAALFPEGDIQALLDGLAGLAGDETQVTTEAVLSVLTSSPAARLMLFARSLEGIEFIRRGGRLVQIERGAKGRFGDMLDGPELDAIIANPKPGDREKLKAHFGAMKTPELRAEAKKRGVYISDVTRKEQMADRIVEHEIGHKLDSQSIRHGDWDDSSAWTRPAEMQLGSAAAPDLDKMTNPQLKELAKAKGVKGYSKMRKADLTAAIKDADARQGGLRQPKASSAQVSPRIRAVLAEVESSGGLEMTEYEFQETFDLTDGDMRRLRQQELIETDDEAGGGYIGLTPQGERVLLESAGPKSIPDTTPPGRPGRAETIAALRNATVDDEQKVRAMLAGLGKDELNAIARELETSRTVGKSESLQRHIDAIVEGSVGFRQRADAMGGNWVSRQQVPARQPGAAPTLPPVAVTRPRARRSAQAMREQEETERRRRDIDDPINSGMKRIVDLQRQRDQQQATPAGGVGSTSARAELDRMRANPQPGDRAKVAAILKPMRHKDLDQLAADNGWVLPGKATLPQKREQLEEHLVGRRLSSDAIFGLKDRPRDPLARQMREDHDAIMSWRAEDAARSAGGFANSATARSALTAMRPEARREYLRGLGLDTSKMRALAKDLGVKSAARSNYDDTIAQILAYFA